MRWTTPLSIAFLSALVVGSLQGCATHPVVPPITAPLPAVASPSCIAVKTYTQDQLDQMAAAVRALPAESPLQGLVVDYQRLRDEARAACPK
jgi:hypothetical protein